MAPAEPEPEATVTPATAAVISLDVDEVLGEAARAYADLPAEERARHRAAVERARFEAAEYLVDGGSPADARLAARWLLVRAA